MDDAVELDLSGLTAIRRIDDLLGFAEIEPGVTQTQLAAALMGSRFTMNPTASAGFSSIVGNLLDHGQGFLGERVDDLLGLEVVLPGGEVVALGAQRPLGGVVPHVHGLGPNLAPLFLQSSFGVVTAATIRLHPRPRATTVMACSSAHLGALLEHAIHVRIHGLVDVPVRVYAPSARQTYAGRGEQAIAYLRLAGLPAVMAAYRAEVIASAEARGISVREVTRTDDPLERAVVSCLQGDPSHNDAMIQASFGCAADQLDHASRHGWLTVMAVLPPLPDRVESELESAQALAAAQGIGLQGTVHVLGPTVLSLVLGVTFERTDAGIASAHAVASELYERLGSRGWLPYRIDVDRRPWFSERLVDPRYRQLLIKLGKVFDPLRVLAPGPYTPIEIDS